MSTPPTVAIAEDDELLLRLISRAIRDDEYDVLEYADGSETVRALPRVEDIDVLLTDADASPPSGATLARAVRERFPDVRFVVLSSGAAPPWPADLAGAARFLDKPFAVTELREAVRAAARRSPAT